MNSFNVTLLALIVAVILSACGKKQESTVSSPAVTVAPAPASAASAASGSSATNEVTKTEEKK